MALCEPCKEDAHARCGSIAFVSWPRSDKHKKRNHGSRRVACGCVCRLPDGWRGSPTLPPRVWRLVRG